MIRLKLWWHGLWHLTHRPCEIRRKGWDTEHFCDCGYLASKEGLKWLKQMAEIRIRNETHAQSILLPKDPPKDNQ